MPSQKVAVIIPIYKPQLSDYDRISISRTYDLLSSYPLIVIHPDNLDISAISTEFPNLTFQPFAPRYFDGIMGYNSLMLSSDFYGAFLQYEYILICQTDVYIFRDELEQWCNLGYDYIGAPWLKKKIYDLPVISQIMSLSLRWKHHRGLRSKQDLYGKIGNGGLSLRKTSNHYRIVTSMTDVIRKYTDRNKKMHLYNEDVFWALEPSDFSYPTVEEAMKFSFDKYPRLTYKLNHGNLPFGCHAWFSRKMSHFWKTIIPDAFPN